MIYNLGYQADIDAGSPVFVGEDAGPDGSGPGGGVTLTIEPGVTIIGQTGGPLVQSTSDDDEPAPAFANTSFLFVNRGNRIEALGTAEEPITFTAQIPENSATGVPAGTIIDEDAPLAALVNADSLWGSVVIAGRAPLDDSQPGIATVVDETFTPLILGGGSPAITDDDSGIMTFVRIVGPGLRSPESADGLGLLAVGSGTVIENIQVRGSGGDGIVLEGGTVDVRNVLVTGFTFDGIEYSNGFNGSIQNVVVSSLASLSLSTALEGTLTFEFFGEFPDELPAVFANPVISDVTLVGDLSFAPDEVVQISEGLSFTSVTAGTWSNISVSDYRFCSEFGFAEALGFGFPLLAEPFTFNSVALGGCDLATAPFTLDFGPDILDDGVSLTVPSSGTLVTDTDGNGILELNLDGTNNVISGYTPSLVGRAPGTLAYINGPSENDLIAFDSPVTSTNGTVVIGESVGAVSSAEDDFTRPNGVSWTLLLDEQLDDIYAVYVPPPLPF